MQPFNRRSTIAVSLAVFLLIGACGRTPPTSDARKSGDAVRPFELTAQVARFDLVAGRSDRFMVGLLAGDQSSLVAFGAVRVSFGYLGSRGSGRPAGAYMPPVAATFLPIPGQKVEPGVSGPRLVRPSEGIGVYGAPGITFDRPGFWQVTATATIKGRTYRARSPFEVAASSTIPAVGDLAPRTEQPLAGAPDVDPRSIDSRAGSDAPVPDPELHATTISAALAAGRPLMVVVSTPTYCQSRFCGPITDSVSNLSKRYADRMDFVHLEVWKDFEKGEINAAAAEWIFPSGNGDAREPWVFVVGRDGHITHRFGNVVTDAELEQAADEATR